MVIVVVSSSLGDSDSVDQVAAAATAASAEERPEDEAAKTYVVESGDTLVAIAHRTGVPVGHILALNPEVDPQILIAGETLKLR